MTDGKRDSAEIQVHSVSAEYHGGNRHDDSYRCQKFHNAIDIIGNDRREGVHHAVEDTRIDMGHLDGLLVLGDDILQ